LLVSRFKQARDSIAVISSSLLREKALHIATRLGTGDFKASNDWINNFKQLHSVVNKTVTVQLWREWRKEQLLKITGVLNL
jgi:hypothetical protein